MSWLLFVDSTDPVRLYPEWNFKRNDEQIRSESVVRSGRRFVYRWGRTYRWMFDVSYINSQEASYINCWWDNNSAVTFVNEDDVTETYSVMILNDKIPVNGFIRPYTDMFAGTIELGTY